MFRLCAVLIVINAYSLGAPNSCDSSIHTASKEGNVGETGTFPWLGVLRVHLKEGDELKVALTGLLLIKEGYAIANADDVARIPKRIFKQDSNAMFIPKNGTAWFCKLVDYITHPEYESTTTNTLALIELDPGEGEGGSFPMKPICWPPDAYNTSNDLYAVGFTDENLLLEKAVYSLQHLELKHCKEFYNRAGLEASQLTPTQYVCGIAKNNQEDCIWDNGIVLASNTTGTWRLIGFGIRGPGCASPARFIDIKPYLPWIDSVTNFSEAAELNYRKSAFNEGFRKQLRLGESEENGETPDLTFMFQHHYPFDTEFVQNEYFTVDRIGVNAINIRNISLPAEHGNCTSASNQLIYRDETIVHAGREAYLSYRVSMYDLNYLNYSCVKIWIRPAKCTDKASLYYEVKIDHKEGSSFHDFGTTPERILQVYPYQPIALKTTTTKPGQKNQADLSKWEPGPHLKVSFIEDKDPVINMENYNIYLKFQFDDVGIINIEVLGPLISADSRTTSSTTEALRVGKELNDEFVIRRNLGADSNRTEPNGTVHIEPPPSVVKPTTPSLRLANSYLVSAVQTVGTSLIEVITIEVLVVWFLYLV